MKSLTQYVVSMTNLNSSLCTHTLLMLQNRSVKLTYRKIAEDTKIAEGWLSMFGQGKILNPGIRQVQTLYEYLSKKQLKF